MSLQETEYVKMIRKLPPPTPSQTVLFASYVSEAHSWYKHLPISPKVPFYFYLDPHAGKNLIHTQTGEIAMLEITDESRPFHYTWQTTKDYHSRFGFWNYQTNYGTSFLFSSDGGIANTKGSQKLILNSQGGWTEVPMILQELGIVYLSALVHPQINLLIWLHDLEHFGLSEMFEDTNIELPDCHLKSLLIRLYSILNRTELNINNFTIKNNSEKLAPTWKKISNFLEKNQNLWQHWYWKQDQAIPLLITPELELKESLIPLIIQKLEQLRTQEYLQQEFKLFEELDEHPKLAAFYQQLQQRLYTERMTQLFSMIQAMNQFVENIYEIEVDNFWIELH